VNYSGWEHLKPSLIVFGVGMTTIAIVLMLGWRGVL